MIENTSYIRQDFEKQFLHHDFDSILLVKNNPVVNDKTYLDVKKQYFLGTTKNLFEFHELWEVLKKFDTPVYYFDSEAEIRNTIARLRHLLRSQETLFRNFLIYIEHLNENFQHERNSKKK